MDVCESEKEGAVDNSRPPLGPAERNNAVTTRRPRTREVSSRYKSPSPSTPSGPRRCPSPNHTRTVPTSSHLASKRAQSAERKRHTTLRPSTPPSPTSPSTPVRDSSVDMQLLSRRITTGRLPESLWPSTMRSLSVSFQSDTISIPICKKEKPVINASMDRTLRPSSNVAHKQAEMAAGSRKQTPERKRSPLKGKNVQDQSENAKPVDGLHTRMIDQHRWPSRIGGKLSSNSVIKTVDLVDKAGRSVGTPVSEAGLCNRRRLSLDSATKPLQKSASDAERLLSLEIGRAGYEAHSIDDSSIRVSEPHKIGSRNSSDKIVLITPAARSQSLPSPGAHPPSPRRTSLVSSSVSRGVSPSRTARPSTPPSRGVSPSRIRPSSSSGQSNNTTSVLSFIADFKKGKKGASYIEDAHQLRLLYNRYLQWRFANAQAEAIIHLQKGNVEKTLYNVWNDTVSLWDSVVRKRINLQRLKLKLKLYSILNDQMSYLDDWSLLESDHISSLAGAVEDLEASTVRLPVTGGARADIESLKVIICSTVDMMQAIGSSVYSLLSRVEDMNTLVSQLAVVAAEEKAMLEECEALLASAAAMQVEEYSVMTNLIQSKQDLEKSGKPVLAVKTTPLWS